MKQHITSFSLLLTATALLLAGGCTKRELIVRSEGDLKISLDWGENIPSETTGFYFYDSQGGEVIYREGNSKGFEGKLPAGTYHVVMINNDMVGAGILSQGAYNRDCIAALEEDATRNTTSTYVSHVDNTYGCGISGILVQPSVPTEREVTPRNFARKITFVLDPGEITDISSIDIELDGVARSVYVYNGSASSSTPCRVRSRALPDIDNHTFLARASILGLSGKSELTANLIFSDKGQASSIPEDLSEELKEIPDEGAEVLIDLRLADGRTMGLKVIVHGWDDSGTGGGDIPY